MIDLDEDQYNELKQRIEKPLLATITALTAELKARDKQVRELVEAVQPVLQKTPYNTGMECRYCGGDDHADDCVFVAAREALAQQDQPEQRKATSEIPSTFFISEDGQWDADPVEPCMIEAISGAEHHRVKAEMRARIAALTAERDASRSSHRSLLVAVNSMKNASPGEEHLTATANLLLLTSVQSKEQQQ